MRIEIYQDKPAFFAIVDSEMEIPVTGQRMVCFNREWNLYHLNSQELCHLENFLGRGFLWFDDEINSSSKMGLKNNKKSEFPNKIRQVTIYPDQDIIPRLGEAYLLLFPYQVNYVKY